MTILYKERLKGENNPHWKGGNITRVCVYCGKKYKVAPAQVDKSKYCSYKCMGQARIKPRQERMKLERKIIGKHCKLCGISITQGRIYCPICTPRGKSTIISYCEVCGKAIKHWNGRVRRFCSNECRLKKHNADGNPNWKGGRLSLSQRIRGCKKNRELVASVLRRDKYICQECGQVGGDLEVDHIRPFAEILDEFLQCYQMLSCPEFEYELYLITLKYKPFWDRKNLRTLCRRCNWKRHIDGTKAVFVWKPEDMGEIHEVLFEEVK